VLKLLSNVRQGSKAVLATRSASGAKRPVRSAADAIDAMEREHDISVTAD
jgi:hypothetical protein